MDFSRPLAALKSLHRRETVPEELKSKAEQLSSVFQDDAPAENILGAQDQVLQLIRWDCWEGVAVGFLLAQAVIEAGCQQEPFPGDQAQSAPLEMAPQVGSGPTPTMPPPPPTSAEEPDAHTPADQNLPPSPCPAPPPPVAESMQSTPAWGQFEDQLVGLCDLHLEHSEPRVRTLVASVLGTLSKIHGSRVYLQLQERLMSALSTNFVRTNETIPDRIAGSMVAVDDTTGWKSLETCFHAIRHIVEGLQNAFIEGGHLTNELWELVQRGATEHVNRHVRESSFQACKALIQAHGVMNVAENKTHQELAEGAARSLSIGLADNWSQVRFAASVCNRAFFLALEEESREQYLPLLLPRMCLNRYYLAEGVKLFSQETWSLLFKTEGRQKVARYAGEVALYYCEIANMDNHVVRESACHSIAEYAVKVDRSAAAPHVGKLLNTLMTCFYDESWPVRDAACVASGSFAAVYPEECRGVLDKLWERWFFHLSDPIWSVREDSAIALGQVSEAYGREAIDRLIQWISENLPKAKEQPAMTKADFDALQNDPQHHSGNQVYSCGSLAPKLKKGGCSDCHVDRPKQLWEYSDGAIYLLRELTLLDADASIRFFEEAASIARLDHFVYADTLRETLWKSVPIIADRLGKKVFKRHMEIFFQPLFQTISRGSCSALAVHAAADCIRFLSKFVGPSIFRGRLTPEMLDVLERNNQLIMMGS